MNLALRLLGQTLREWRWSHTGWAVFIGAATLFANGMPLANGIDSQAHIPLTYNVLQFGVPLVLLLGWAHRLVDLHLLPPALAYAGAVLIEVGAGVWLIGPLLVPWLGAEPWWTVWNDLVLMFSTLIWHGLGVAVVAQRHLHQRAEALRQAAERAHAERARELAATELLALQARVDPRLLFESLQTIDTELANRPAQAGRRLGALIDLLRALQPHAQARQSTLGRELDAVEACARLIASQAQGTERLHISVPESLRELPMAPLVLLPLMRPLLAEPGLLWQIVGSAAEGRPPQLQIIGLGPAPEPLRAAARQVDLALLRQRLAAVLGPQASLHLDDTELPCFTLQWP